MQLDALALADFARPPRKGNAVDLGCGCGILMLLLCAAAPELRCDGVELREEALDRAADNLRANGLEERCSLIAGDLRSAALPGGFYDLAVANPPYFAPGRGAVSPDTDRALMRQESAVLPELCAAAASALKRGGRLCAVYAPARLPELLYAMSGAGLEPKRLRCVQHDARHAPSLILAEGRKGGRPGLTWEPPLLLRSEDGRESAESLRITHWEKEVTL